MLKHATLIICQMPSAKFKDKRKISGEITSKTWNFPTKYEFC